MTLLEERPAPVDPPKGPLTSAPPAGRAGPSTPSVSGSTEGAPPFPIQRCAVAAALATGAAAVVAGGLFRGELARLVAILAGAAGAAVVALAVRRDRPALQYLLAPAAIILGYLVAIVLPNSTGVHGSIPDLVRHAVNNGGLSRPPIPFDPGWRFIIAALFMLLGGAAVSLAAGFSQSKLALVVPLPLVLAGALDQPSSQQVVAGVAALALLVGGLTVTFGAELGGGNEVSRAVQLRQTLRGVAATGLASALLVGLAQFGILFPASHPPSKPRPQKPQVVWLKNVRDRPLFDVTSTLIGPWRLGVLDTYDGSAWLLPGYDPTRLVPLGTGGGVPGAIGRPTTTSTLVLHDVGGFSLPSAANPASLSGESGLGFDPETQLFRAEGGAPGDGYRYTVASANPPSGAELTAAAATPVAPDLQPSLSVPAPPPAVAALLAKAPANRYERLQFLRNTLYDKVIAVGGGVPVDIAPARVDQLITGGKGSPYEIVASEALLARWAGVPSRIGYGFNGGTPLSGGAVEFRPRDGADWLEVNFPGLGWVPIVGTPPHAQASLDSDPKNQTAVTRPSNELSLKAYIPVEEPDPTLLFQVVRYYLARVVPLLLLAFALALSVPALAKVRRRRQRLVWAATRGPAGRIAVAYAELRELARDLAVDDGASTPLGFLAVVVEDDEHAELAWLVTRGLWGDLTRDLTDADALAAEKMSRSLRQRLAKAQPPATRASALVSRSSLRTPYDAGLPNPWRRPRPAVNRPPQRRRSTRLARLGSTLTPRKARPA